MMSWSMTVQTFPLTLFQKKTPEWFESRAVVQKLQLVRTLHWWVASPVKMHNTAATDGSLYLQINCVWHTEQNSFLPSVWTLERLTVLMQRMSFILGVISCFCTFFSFRWILCWRFSHVVSFRHLKQTETENENWQDWNFFVSFI